jgi:hypothetical protein
MPRYSTLAVLLICCMPADGQTDRPAEGNNGIFKKSFSELTGNTVLKKEQY